MDYYNILGVNENASKNEIKVAYENKVKKIKEEVPNEKRAKMFIKAFDEAYEALMKLEESGQAPQRLISDIEEAENKTVIMKPQEIQQELEKQRRVSTESGYSETKKRSTRKSSTSRSKSSSSSSSSSKKKPKSKKDYSEDENIEKKNKERRNEKKNKQRVVRESQNSTASTIMSVLILPLKILALPIIAILSVIIILCKTINVVSWLASKVIIACGIGIGAIHLYQINLGEVMNEKLLFAVVVAVVASFFLPSILRIVPKIFGSLNDALKNFVF